jgi:chaperone required for assembly of F1-ATPase
MSCSSNWILSGRSEQVAERRRFYKSVTVSGDLAIALDGRPVKTPLKQVLRLPSRPLAEAVAAEWAGQGETIEPFSMVMTRLANTAIDRVIPERARIIAELVAFAGCDLICYRAAAPPELLARQEAAWDPVLAWARARLDASFLVVHGIAHRPQPERTLSTIATHLESIDAFSLTALHNMATLTGSALLAAMVGAGALAPEAAWRAAHVDEDFQIAHWGEDAEAAARRLARHVEFEACCRFLVLVGRP